MDTLTSPAERLLRGILAFPVVFLLAGLFAVASSGQTPSAPTSTESSRPVIDVERVQNMVHAQINDVRAERGLSPLEYNRSLDPLARVHSEDMARRDFFGHTNPDGDGVNERARQLGLTCTLQLDEQRTAHGFGENLYTGTLYRGYRDIFEGDTMVRREYDWKDESSIARGIVNGWMNSPGHRANILDSRYETEALSTAIDDDTFYVTQIFC
ncbi:hypothetical protein CRI94_02220 [Longibacter salinarum]|uniref:SCP domain-containing protein n=1 Tax=Longibacter salinarum TaxID=1850348 RepID=A0A2A8D2G9_9BACT|nr:CAP domain-containing protein [Longibacter salinarum]PEN15126.1 hypothetical protein CRI94_02220 [Longibacter salinarum]